MKQEGFWALFWATGLPEAWLGTKLDWEPIQPPESIACHAPSDSSNIPPSST